MDVTTNSVTNSIASPFFFNTIKFSGTLLFSIFQEKQNFSHYGISSALPIHLNLISSKNKATDGTEGWDGHIKLFT